MIALYSFIICFIAIYFSNKLFIKNKWFDKINNRSSHSSQATRNGGIAVFSSLFIISFTYYLLGYELYDYSLVIPLGILFFIGLYDDIYQVDFKLKFIFQIIVAKIFIDNGLIIDNLHGFIGIFELNRLVAQIFTLAVIVSIINSINFIDGIDGLAISVVGLFIIFFEFFNKDYHNYNYISLIILSSSIPLLYYNFRNKNKVFLGDSGSLFLGGVVSIYIISVLKNDFIIKPEYDINKILFVISILFYPIVDFTRIIFIRLLNKKSPFIADNKHIHHILLKKIKNHFYIDILIIFTTIFVVYMNQLIFN